MANLPLISLATIGIQISGALPEYHHAVQRLCTYSLDFMSAPPPGANVSCWVGSFPLLTFAVVNGRVGLVRGLLNRTDIDVNMLDSKGRSALHNAIECEQVRGRALVRIRTYTITSSLFLPSAKL